MRLWGATCSEHPASLKSMSAPSGSALSGVLAADSPGDPSPARPCRPPLLGAAEARLRADPSSLSASCHPHFPSLPGGAPLLPPLPSPRGAARPHPLTGQPTAQLAPPASLPRSRGPHTASPTPAGLSLRSPASAVPFPVPATPSLGSRGRSDPLLRPPPGGSAPAGPCLSPHPPAGDAGDTSQILDEVGTRCPRPRGGPCAR